MNGEFESLWKVVSMAWLKYCPEICLDGLRGTTDLQDSRCLSRRLHRIHTEYKSHELALEPCRNRTQVWRAWCTGNYCWVLLCVVLKWPGIRIHLLHPALLKLWLQFPCISFSAVSSVTTNRYVFNVISCCSQSEVDVNRHRYRVDC